MDTSVFGGYYDKEFKKPTTAFFNAVLTNQVTILISETLVGEIVDAPEHVQQLLEQALHGKCERLALSSQVELLRDAYLAARIVPPKWSDDALHVAHAVLACADVIASWNFKHLVNPMRIRGFNAVNARLGYGSIVIMTPEDIIRSWKEDENEPRQKKH